MTATILTHSKELWYLMRASGLVALALLSLTMVAGIVNVRRYATPRWPRAITALLHRNVALLAVVFLAVHVATAALDSFIAVGWLATVIPFTSQWDRLWVGLGTASVDMMVAVVVTSLLRSRLTHRSWRAVHWLAYASWPLAMIHGFGAGTDSGAVWADGVYVASLMAVAGAVGWRLHRPVPTFPPVPSRLPAGTWRPASTPAGAPARVPVTSGGPR
jgi:sulfoxide reductase heme-binding subunit YedZ